MLFNELGMQLFKDRYAVHENETPEEAIQRIVDFVADTPLEKKAFHSAISAKRFVPAGRIWRSAGTDVLTGDNCFVLPCPHDSMKGILRTLGEMVELMRHGGGVGINISSLRPKGNKVHGVDGTSSGAMSLAELYSFATGMIQQGGLRKGALMLSMHVTHPDILEFIRIKEDMSRFTNANLSVMVTDEFMNDVYHDAEHLLVFPDTQHSAYDENWTGDIDVWKAKYGLDAIVVHKSLPAKEVWDAIIASAHKCAEPGVLFWSTAQQESNTESFSPIIGVNPCAEQALPAYGVCNLGHINLAEFVLDTSEVAWYVLAETVQTGVRFLDNVIDKTNHVLPETHAQQMQERRIGLGVFGYHDMLIKLGLVYGSAKALQFTMKLFEFIQTHAYQASINLAEEKGTYPAFTTACMDDGFLGYANQTGKLKNLHHSGIRNSTILTIAPTGTIAMMYDRSTGIEPHFAYEYTRKWSGGTEIIIPQIVHETENKSLLVTAHDVSPIEHVNTLAVVQDFIDASISKTVNLPEEASLQDIHDMYWTAWVNNCKGCTVYRNYSRNAQVLSVKNETCTECGSEMVNEAGCFICKNCGNSYCSI